MQNSIMNTLAVPLAGSKDPATLYIAAKIPLRIVVRNAGPTLLFLAYSSTDLADVAGVSAQFQLAPNLSEVFILAPKQGIYATSAGVNGIASISVSEAFPEVMV